MADREWLVDLRRPGGIIIQMGFVAESEEAVRELVVACYPGSQVFEVVEWKGKRRIAADGLPGGLSWPVRLALWCWLWLTRRL